MILMETLHTLLLVQQEQQQRQQEPPQLQDQRQQQDIASSSSSSSTMCCSLNENSMETPPVACQHEQSRPSMVQNALVLQPNDISCESTTNQKDNNSNYITHNKTVAFAEEQNEYYRDTVRFVGEHDFTQHWYTRQEERAFRNHWKDLVRQVMVWREQQPEPQYTTQMQQQPQPPPLPEAAIPQENWLSSDKIYGQLQRYAYQWFTSYFSTSKEHQQSSSGTPKRRSKRHKSVRSSVNLQEPFVV